MKQVISVPKNVGNWVVLAGSAIVVLNAVDFTPFWPKWTLAALGIFLGLSHINDPKNFVLAGLALIGANIGLQSLPIVGGLAQGIVHEMVMLVAPAMLVVSLRMIYEQLYR